MSGIEVYTNGDLRYNLEWKEKRSDKYALLIKGARRVGKSTIAEEFAKINPGVGMSLEKDAGRYKLFSSDVGLFVTLAFKDKKYTENVIYNKLLSDKLEANLGYVFENVVHTKDYKWENGIHYIPVYMVPFL